MGKIKIKNYKILVPIILMILMAIFFSTQSEYFASWSNFINILREASIPGIIGVGLVVVMAGGDIDLSTGSIVGCTSMLTAICIAKMHLITAVTIPVIMILGAACGLFNAILIEKLNLNAFIVTIATQNVFKGLQTMLCFRDAQGNAYTEALTNRVFLNLGSGKIGDFYYSIIIFFVLVIVVQILLKQTKLGINIYAVGSSRAAAELSGVKINLIRRIAFGICGACCGLAAVLTTARSGASTGSTGTGLEFDAICATIIGGAGGSGIGGDTSAIAPLVGAIFVEMMMNGIYKIKMPAAFQTIFKGSALILMILLDALFVYIRSRRRAKVARAEALKGGAGA